MSVLALAISLATQVAVQAMPLPVVLQGALFNKIFHYDRTLDANTSNVTVLVVYGGSSSSEAAAVATAFKATGVTALVTPQSQLAKAAAKADVVYVAGGTNVRAVKAVCAAHKLLSITGRPELVERGSVAVGLDRDAGNHPKILVNLPRLRAEGHALSSHLLGLATVIQ